MPSSPRRTLAQTCHLSSRCLLPSSPTPQAVYGCSFVSDHRHCPSLACPHILTFASFAHSSGGAERAESDLEKRVLTAGGNLSKKNGLYLELQKKQTETEKLLSDKTTELERASTLTEELTRKLKRAELLALEQTEDIQNKDELLQKRQTELDRERG